MMSKCRVRTSHAPCAWSACISLTCDVVLLQAMKEDPPPDAKCRDKFLVQSVLVTADKEFTNVQSLVSSRLAKCGTWLT
jgi:hypothetical protein